MAKSTSQDRTAQELNRLKQARKKRENKESDVASRVEVRGRQILVSTKKKINEQGTDEHKNKQVNECKEKKKKNNTGGRVDNNAGRKQFFSLPFSSITTCFHIPLLFSSSHLRHYHKTIIPAYISTSRS